MLTLTQVAEEAIGLYTFYPEAAKDYDRARGHRQFATEAARRYGWDLYRDPSGPDLQLQTENCNDHWRSLATLRIAVAGLLPDLRLRLIPMSGKPWHEQKDFDWSAACSELQRIVAAAVRAMEATKPHSANGTSVRGSRGKTSDLILSGLNLHHGYDGTSILNSEPIGVNELAEQISKQRAKDGQNPIHKATVSKWFRDKFGGYDAYKIECATGNLFRSLKLLNGDYSPRMVSQAVAEKAAEE